MHLIDPKPLSIVSMPHILHRSFVRSSPSSIARASLDLTSLTHHIRLEGEDSSGSDSESPGFSRSVTSTSTASQATSADTAKKTSKAARSESALCNRVKDWCPEKALAVVKNKKCPESHVWKVSPEFEASLLAAPVNEFEAALQDFDALRYASLVHQLRIDMRALIKTRTHQYVPRVQLGSHRSPFAAVVCIPTASLARSS